MITVTRSSLIERLSPIGGINKVGHSGFLILSILDEKQVENDYQLTLEILNSEILYHSGLSRQSLRNKRNQLSDVGLFKCYPIQGKKSVTYELNPKFFPAPDENDKELDQILSKLLVKFPSKLVVNFLTNFLENRVSSIERMTEGRIDRMTDNRPETNVWEDIMKTWQEVFGKPMRSNNVDFISAYIDQEGMDESLILEGIDRTQKSDKKAVAYLRRILNEWAQADIKSMSDLVSYDLKKNSEQPPVKKNGNGNVADFKSKQEQYKQKYGF